MFGTRVFVIDNLECLLHRNNTETEKSRRFSTNHGVVLTRTFRGGWFIDEISKTEKLQIVTLNVRFYLTMLRNKIFSNRHFRQFKSKVLIGVHDAVSK